MINLKKNSLHLLNNIWPFILIVIIVGIFFWKFFIKGLIPIPGDFVVGTYYPWLDYKWGYSVGVPVKNPITADVPSFIFPMQIYANDIVKSGKLPLWNPLILMGTPLLANFQSAPYSPTNILYLLTDKLTAWSIQIILQHIFAAIFTYILLRYWKVTKFGALLGGIIFAFSGFNLIWSQWNGHALTASFIPLLLFFEDKWLKNGSAKYGVVFSLVLCLSVLSGYPQTVLYTLLTIFILAIVRLVQNHGKAQIFRTIAMLIFIFFGFLLSAFQILPGAELLKYSQRGVEFHPYDWAFLPWQKFITFISSDYFGNHSTNNYWGPQDYTSNTGFVGVVGFVLAGFSFLLIKKNKEVLFAFILIITSLVLSFPTPISVLLWKSRFLGFNAAAAHRSLVIFDFGVAVLAGFGYDFIQPKNFFKKYFLILLIPATTIVFFIFHAYLIKNETVHGQSVFSVAFRNLILPSIILLTTSFVVIFRPRWKLVLLFLSVFELFYFGWKFTPFSSRNIVFPTTPVIDFLQSQKKPFRVDGNKIVPMNVLMAYNLESPEGYDAVYTKSISKFISSLNDGSSDTKFSGRYGSIDRTNSRLLDLVNTKYFIVQKLDKDNHPNSNGSIPEAFKNNKYKNIFEDKSVAVLENTKALPRAFMVYNWEVNTDNKETLNRMLDPNFLLDKKIIINANPPQTPDKLGGKINNKVEYMEYDSQENKISVETEKDGMLFVSDTYYPGWNAFIDGSSTNIYIADYAFRAVFVPKGKHVIDFTYKPDGFFNGVTISFFSLIALIGILLLY